MLKSISTIKICLYAFLLIVFTLIALRLLHHDIAGNGFIFGDWLVNYQDGGFKRRGLIGSIMFFLQDITGLSLLTIVYSTQMLFYSLFFYLFYKLLQTKEISLLYFTLVISPLTFMIYFNDGGMVGRKEIIIFTIFVYYLYSLSKNSLSIYKEYTIYLFLIIGTLIHEITVFYIPYFLLAHYLILGKYDLKKYTLFLLSCIIPAFLIFVFGGRTNEGATLTILAERGVELQSYKYSIFSFTNDLNVHLEMYKDNVIGYGLYAVSLFIGIAHFGWYIKTETKLKLKSILGYFMLVIIYSLPLFYLACDWGRWLQIHFIFLLLILTYKLPKGTKSFESKPLFSFIPRNIQYFGIILFLLVWSVKHFDSGFSFNGFLIILFENIFKIFIFQQ